MKNIGKLNYDLDFNYTLSYYNNNNNKILLIFVVLNSLF